MTTTPASPRGTSGDTLADGRVAAVGMVVPSFGVLPRPPGTLI
ncbi:hypothetical protein SCATT_08620 [Streptantibioticus cattleyicolor NRRL 8057 = DSM 46488]|uniref:Uncharacterized protein n=1 Tax=Streptantibioticus cattleyicolor (strain ATCC 35852 / DSM 46488 / JCM 4925 / NBRC 14057 / NRRL 8057) TaxID=1003195 RepID=G8X1Q9_STREN|nr:hypothetical protein SCATT_08620 [Streptantibioticus cattleyicolor NRRL 8057 = DSM 46488]